MNRYILPIALYIFILLLTGYFLHLLSNLEVVTTPLNNAVIFHPPLNTPQFNFLQITSTQTSQLTSTVSISSNIETRTEPDIPSVINQVYLGAQAIDALTDPATGHLYVMTAQGQLKILELADGKEVTHFETGFQATNDYSGLLLSIDPNRHRLYVQGNQLLIVDTDSLTITKRLNLSGQLTPDPTSNRVYFTPSNSYDANCGTQILDVETWKKIGVLYPAGTTEPPPMMGMCIWFTRLDVQNQILYATGNVCSGGSSCGSLTISIFDVSTSPQYIANIGGQAIAIDSVQKRVYATKRDERGYFPSINRFEIQGQTITKTLSLFGSGNWRQMFYDPIYNKLYGENMVLDSDLALLARIELPGSLLAFDPISQRLYSADKEGNLFIISTKGGEPQPPDLAKPVSNKFKSLENLIAADARQFRIYKGREYLMERRGGVIAASPDYEQDRILLANPPYGNSGGDGLYRSIDGGKTWLPTTHGLTSFQVAEIIFSPTFTRDQTIFLTTEEKGSGYPPYDELFRSTDGGNTWINLTKNLVLDTTSGFSFGRPVPSPTFADDKLVFIGGFRSTDGGGNWTYTGVSNKLVAFSPNFAKDKLIIGTNKSRSIDSGQTWLPHNDEYDSSYLQEIFFAPDFAHNQTVYMLLQLAQFNSKINFYRSTNAGRSWQPLMSELPADFDYAHSIILSNGDLYVTAKDGADLTLNLESLTWGSTEK